MDPMIRPSYLTDESSSLDSLVGLAKPAWHALPPGFPSARRRRVLVWETHMDIGHQETAEAAHRIPRSKGRKRVRKDTGFLFQPWKLPPLGRSPAIKPVSYTHLTLPTIYSV